MLEKLAKTMIVYGETPNTFSLALMGKRFIWVDGAYIGWYRS